MIYFLQHGEDGYIKIGTTQNLRKRLERLREEYGESLEVLAVMEGSRLHEKRLHLRFAHLKRFGEWYKPSAELQAFIKTVTPGVSQEEALGRQDRAPLASRLQQARFLYYTCYPTGLGDGELAHLLGSSRMTACRYRLLLQGIRVSQGKYVVLPSPQEIEQAMKTLQLAIRSERITPLEVLFAFGEPGDPAEVSSPL